MSSPVHETITVGGIPTHRVVYTPAAVNRAPILMLHGWGANATLMTPVAERLAPLGYTIHVLDLPAFGESAPPPVAWSIHDYAQWVVQYLDQTGLARVHLIGHSFGGRLGLILGAEHGNRLFHMALADAAGIPPKRPLSQTLRLKLYKFLRDGMYRIGARQPADSLRAWYNKRYGSSDFQQTSGVLRETFVKVVNEDLTEYARRVSVPTILFWGDQDMDTPLWQGQTLEKLIPDAGLIVFNGAGHYSYLEHLGEFVRIVDHFFSS